MCDPFVRKPQEFNTTADAICNMILDDERDTEQLRRNMWGSGGYPSSGNNALDGWTTCCNNDSQFFSVPTDPAMGPGGKNC